MKTLLHVGCGPEDKSDNKGFNNDDWKEVRFDIDESVNPDIIGTLTDMNLVETSSVDAIYSAYNLDHIYAHEVPIALGEFYRVLKDDGIAFIRCPDIQSVCEAVVQDKLIDIFYETEDGQKISPLDILLGNREELASGNEYMAKKVGFTYSALDASFSAAGFKTRYGGRIPKVGGELGIVAFKQEKPEEEIKKIATPFNPLLQFE